MGGLPSFNRGIDLNVVHIVFGIYINVVNMEVSEGCPLIAVYTLCSLLRDYPVWRSLPSFVDYDSS
jgi:hypothetical protein